MCGRFALTAPASTIAEIFQADVLPDVLPRYNIAPGTQILGVVQEGDRRVGREFRWGLVPFWAKDPKIGYRTINARSETAAKKPAFRAAFRKRRLLIPATGFYEWKREGPKRKIPHLVGMRDGRLFAMAGLWERWTDPASGEALLSCTILTTGPNELVAEIHDRMPAILPPDRWALWLDPAVTDPERVQELLVPYPAREMAARPVSSRVNHVKNQGPEVQAPWEGD